MYAVPTPGGFNEKFWQSPKALEIAQAMEAAAVNIHDLCDTRTEKVCVCVCVPYGATILLPHPLKGTTKKLHVLSRTVKHAVVVVDYILKQAVNSRRACVSLVRRKDTFPRSADLWSAEKRTRESPNIRHMPWKRKEEVMISSLLGYFLFPHHHAQLQRRVPKWIKNEVPSCHRGRPVRHESRNFYQGTDCTPQAVD